MTRFLGLVALVCICSGCGPTRHFILKGPAKFNASGTGWNIIVEIEEGGYYDTHQHEPLPPGEEPTDTVAR